MNDQLKQRLVGAIVLVSLAVIFIPMILPGGGGLGNSVDGRNIPPEPDYRFSPPKPAPQVPALVGSSIVPIEDSANQDDKESDSEDGGDKSAKSNQETVPEKTAEQSGNKVSDKSSGDIKSDGKEVPEKPSVNAKTEVVKPADIKPGQASAWVVQVGSFSSEPNARDLRDKLRKMGHATFVEAVKTKQGMVYRVRVGPELTRSLAEKLKMQLEKDAKLNGLVQSYP